MRPNDLDARVMRKNRFEGGVVAMRVQPKVARNGDVDNVLHHDTRRVGSAMNVELADATIAAVARKLVVDERCNRRILEPRGAIGIRSIRPQEGNDRDETAGRSPRKLMGTVGDHMQLYRFSQPLEPRVPLPL